jgi:hypothetical protein
LLDNGSVNMFPRQRIEAVTDKILEMVVSIRFDRVEAGSNTSTVTLRVVGDDEKGSLKSETVKYGCESQGTRIRERLRWQGTEAHTKYRPILVREGIPQKPDRNCQ